VENIFFPPLYEIEHEFWKHKFSYFDYMFFGSKKPENSLNFFWNLIAWMCIFGRLILAAIFIVYALAISICIFLICSMLYCIIFEVL